jgi:hypothetical protein
MDYGFVLKFKVKETMGSCTLNLKNENSDKNNETSL